MNEEAAINLNVRLQEEVEDGITNYRNSVNLVTRWGGEQLTVLVQQLLLKKSQVWNMG